jgi:hypothetical protein
MKKCFYFPTWEEGSQVALRLDESSLFFLEGNYDIPLTTTSDPILAKLCELTGAKMYGDYVVFDDNNVAVRRKFFWSEISFLNMEVDYLCSYSLCIMETDSAVVQTYKLEKKTCDEGCCCMRLKYFNIGLRTIDELPKEIMEHEETVCENIFHEYSKFLRKEENKLEEIAKVLDITL